MSWSVGESSHWEPSRLHSILAWSSTGATYCISWKFTKLRNIELHNNLCSRELQILPKCTGNLKVAPQKEFGNVHIPCNSYLHGTVSGKVKLCLYVIMQLALYHKEMAGGGAAPPFLTSALDGGEWWASRPGRFTPGAHWIGGWVGTRAGLHAMEKRNTSCPCPESNPSPACSLVAIRTELSRKRNSNMCRVRL
jgi:hypothetical protein